MSDEQQIADTGPEPVADLPDAQEAVQEAHENAWESVMSKIAVDPITELAEVEPTTQDVDNADTPAPSDADDPGTVEQDGTPDVDDEPTQDAELEEQEEPEPSPTLAYRVTDAEGTDVAVELPEGATISFRADGQDISVSSVNELVEMAQKGAYFGRRMREVSDREKSFSAREQQYQSQLEEAEKLLEQVLFDDEAYERVRAAAEKWRDPEFREGQKAKAELERTQAQQKQTLETQAQEYWQRVGQASAEYFNSAVQEFDFLRAEDMKPVLDEFFAEYDGLRAQSRERALQVAEERGLTREDAIRLGEAEAVRFLSKENLRAHMEKVNDRYAERLNGRAPRAKPRSPEADAEEHNRHVETKLEQKRTRRTVRKGGSPPDPGPPPEPEPTGFDDRWSRIQQEFAALRSRD